MHAMARDLQRRHGFRRAPTPPDRLHLSLVGIGEDSEPPGRRWIEDVGAIVSRIRMRPFLIQMTTVLSFKRTRGGLWPVVLTGQDGVIGITMLCDAIAAALRAEGLDGRPASTPHVTLAWSGVFVPEQSIPPVSWTASEFVLIDSLKGAGRHQILGRWPLVG